jgi:hypothetical protein
MELMFISLYHDKAPFTVTRTEILFRSDILKASEHGLYSLKITETGLSQQAEHFVC